MSQTTLLECVRCDKALEVDEAQGVIRGVRIIGLESANGRTYQREAIKQAIPLYEGRQINVDHGARTDEPVSVSRRFGWLSGVHQESDGGARGNLHYLKSHPMAALVVEVARRRPQLLGLSHNASGRTRREDGREIVEAIDTVHSVDVVADPASTSGFHEGRHMTVKKKVRDLIESTKGKRPGYSRGLKEAAEAGLMSPDMEMDAPPEESTGSEGGDHEEALEAGFKAAMMAIVDDKSMDMKAKLAKFKEILAAQEKLLGGKKDEPAEFPATEARLRLQLKGRDLLSEARIQPDRILLKAIDGCTSEAEIRELIEAAKGRGVPSGARSAAPKPGAGAGGAPGAGAGGTTRVQEGKQGDDAPPTGDGVKLGKWLQVGS